MRHRPVSGRLSNGRTPIMTEPRTVAVVGAGLAGGKAVEALRAEGFGGRIVLFGDEVHRPYERPPLSKGYLQGNDERGTVFVHPESWYGEHDVDLRLGAAVTGLDRHAHELMTDDGQPVHYDRLLLATGASPRHLRLPGADLPGVHYLRTLDDSDALRAAFRPGANVVVIGAGWIGLETAAAARTAGATVTVLESAELPLLRVLGPQMAQVFAGLHRENGVDLRLGVTVAALHGDGSAVTGVELGDGAVIDADTVVVGVGVTPNVDLARQAGLEVDDGVLVNASLRTSDARVYAVGDVANAEHPVLRRRIRVEHWANALHQPEIAARSILGQEAVYDRLPYFFTDQYDLGMEYVGYASADDDVVVRGDLEAREFVALWVRGGRVVAGMNVNVWDVTDRIRDLILAGEPADAFELPAPSA
jgi:3-phenylpropionate/trans-cinnamate dioxygenase ferredoxin reductase subunit